jgi:hypothetical protein
MDDIKRVVTGKVRLSYANLVTPRAQKQGDKLKYSTTLLIPKSDIATKQRIDAAINAAIQEGITSKWNGARPAQPAIPIYDGDGVRPTGEYFSPECKGHWVVTASSEQRPQIVDINMNDIINATEIYSGMYARVSIRFFSYFNSGKKGVGCGLGNVQKLEDGEPLGGRTNAADDFGGGAGGYNPGPVHVPGYQQQPMYNPQTPAYAPQQPVYPQTPGYTPQQPAYTAPAPQQPMYPQQPVKIDPITGAPINGGIMGL